MIDTEDHLARLEKAVREIARQAAAKCWEDDILQILDPKHKRDERFDGG